MYNLLSKGCVTYHSFTREHPPPTFEHNFDVIGYNYVVFVGRFIVKTDSKMCVCVCVCVYKGGREGVEEEGY